MDCSCDAVPIRFAVPPALRDCAPEASDAAAICPHCLAVAPADEVGAGEHIVNHDDTADPENQTDSPDFARASEAFPDGEAGVALALVLGLCDSLATNRAAIETALEAVERAGADPLLAMDRLAADPSVEPAVDLERRRHQLEQLLY